MKSETSYSEPVLESTFLLFRFVTSVALYNLFMHYNLIYWILGNILKNLFMIKVFRWFWLELWTYIGCEYHYHHQWLTCPWSNFLVMSFEFDNMYDRRFYPIIMKDLRDLIVYAVFSVTFLLQRAFEFILLLYWVNNKISYYFKLVEFFMFAGFFINMLYIYSLISFETKLNNFLLIRINCCWPPIYS